MASDTSLTSLQTTRSFVQVTNASSVATTTVNVPEHDHDSVAIGLKSVSLVLLLGAIVLTNSLVCVVYIKQAAIRTVPHTFVLSLAICDLAIAAVCLVLTLSTTAIDEDSPRIMSLCQVQGYLSTALFAIGNLTVGIIAVDRNRVIISPLYYEDAFTPRVARITIVCTWGFGLLLAFPPLVGWGKFSYNPKSSLCDLKWVTIADPAGFVYQLIYCLLAFFGPLLCMLIAYCQVFAAAMKHVRRIRKVRPYPQPEMTQKVSTVTIAVDSVSVAPASQFPSPNGITRYRRRRQRNEIKAVRTILIIFSTYVGCWGPFWIVALLKMSGLPVSPKAEVVATWLAYASAAINPAVYAFLNRQIRQETKKLLTKTFKRPPPSETSTRVEDGISTGNSTLSKRSNVVKKFSWSSSSSPRGTAQFAQELRRVCSKPDMHTILECDKELEIDEDPCRRCSDSQLLDCSHKFKHVSTHLDPEMKKSSSAENVADATPKRQRKLRVTHGVYCNHVTAGAKGFASDLKLRYNLPGSTLSLDFKQVPPERVDSPRISTMNETKLGHRKVQFSRYIREEMTTPQPTQSGELPMKSLRSVSNLTLPNTDFNGNEKRGVESTNLSRSIVSTSHLPLSFTVRDEVTDSFSSKTLGTDSQEKESSDTSEPSRSISAQSR